MTDNWQIRRAGREDTEAVTTLVHALLDEIDPESKEGYTYAKLEPVAEQLLGDRDVFIFLALDQEDSAAGLVTLNRCKAIYAYGEFGEICELYVDPQFRSSGLGQALVNVAVELARKAGWKVLEVGAPDLPRGQRTVYFYLDSHLEEIGPRLYRAINRE